MLFETVLLLWASESRQLQSHNTQALLWLMDFYAPGAD